MCLNFEANTDVILLSCSRIFTRFFNVDRIGVNEWLRVPSVHDVYAIGDCSGFLESTGKEVLPALAQVVSSFLLQYKSVTEMCTVLWRYGHPALLSEALGKTGLGREQMKGYT